MKNKYAILFSIITLCILVSCGGGNKPNAQQVNKISQTEHSYVPMYAKGFKLNKTSNGETMLQVSNPWQGASNVVFTYYLKPDADPKKMDEIKTPINRIICLSTTHIAYIDALGKAKNINGISGATYVSNTIVKQGVANKEVFDVGYEAGLSYETVVSLKPDVVFAYGISGELTGISTKLNELGIKVVFLGDYLEETPLGKAEWLMPIAAFFNAEDQAKSVLDPIFSSYNELTNRVATEVQTQPKVMLNAPWKDSWFIPGGKSYMANLLKDAGANFIFGDNDKRDSYPISIERAYIESINAEYWLNPNAVQSLAELKQVDGRLAKIPAFQNNKVYNNNARMTAGGGSDFWESGVMNPHIILKDMVKIFHPQLMPEHQLIYHHQLR